jgi:hypothetical protein
MEGLLRAIGTGPAADVCSKDISATKITRASTQDEIWLGGTSSKTTCWLKRMDGLKHDLLVHSKFILGTKLRIDSEGVELEGVAWVKASSLTDEDIAQAVRELQRDCVLKAESGVTETYAKVNPQELRDNSLARMELYRFCVPTICFYDQEESKDGKVVYTDP